MQQEAIMSSSPEQAVQTPQMEGMTFSSMEGLGSPLKSDLNGGSMEFIPTGDPNTIFGGGFNEPPLLPAFGDPMANFVPAGPAWPNTLNLFMRPDQGASEPYGRYLALQGRLERVEASLGQMQTTFLAFMHKLDQQEKAELREIKISESIEKIKKGLDKFFTQYASQLEYGACEGVGQTSKFV